MASRQGDKEQEGVGSGLRSHTVTSAVPSALAGLTTGFGMETGWTPAAGATNPLASCLRFPSGSLRYLARQSLQLPASHTFKPLDL